MLRYRFLPAILIAALLIAGPLLSGRLVPPIVGVSMFVGGGALGLAFGATMLGAGFFGLLRRRDWAPRILAAGLLPLLGALIVAGIFVGRPGPAYRFNDVTTDLTDPPSFTEGPAAGQSYPADFRVWHAEVYPDLKPQPFDAAPDTVFDAALATAQTTEGCELVHQDRAAGLIQVLARSALFRFEDDVVIRIRAARAGSIVDLRSKSRVGQGDRGANAERIRDFLTRLSRRLTPSS